MKVLVVLAHPEINSFNSEVARQAERTLRAQGHQVQISDLYRKGFDPCEHGRHYAQRKNPDRFYAQAEQRFNGDQGSLPIDVQSEIDGVLWADCVLFQFPLWWFGMPAILKGWMDRVFVYGTLYSGSRRFHNGVCSGKRAMLSVTAGSSAQACAHDGREGDTRLILWPINYALHYVGFTVLEPLILTSIREVYDDTEMQAHERVLEAQLKSHAEQISNLNNRPPIPFNGEEDWDEHRKLKPGAPVFSPFICHRRDAQIVGQRDEQNDGEGASLMGSGIAAKVGEAY